MSPFQDLLVLAAPALDPRRSAPHREGQRVVAADSEGAVVPAILHAGEQLLALPQISDAA
jgi:hypothetical protein